MSVEWFNEVFADRIGSLIGTVIKVDKTTVAAVRGQFVRFAVEIDLSKSLLSKFEHLGRE